MPPCGWTIEGHPEARTLFAGFAGAEVQSMAMVPLTSPDAVQALVLCACWTGEALGRGAKELFEKATEALRVALERRQKWAELQTAATHDGLTGLANRWAFEQDLASSSPMLSAMGSRSG